MMATKKKAVKKAAPKKVGPKKTATKSKFKKKSADGSARRGPKKTGILFEQTMIVNMIVNGPAPRNVPRLVTSIIKKLDSKTVKSILIAGLANLDPTIRETVIKRYCPPRKLTVEQSMLIKLGKRAKKLLS